VDLVLLGINLVRECNTGHTVLDSQNIVVYSVYSVQTFSGIGLWILDSQLRIVDSREIERTTWLGPVHSETEWPREQWERIERRWRERRRVHFMNHVVMERVRHVFEQSETVDVKRCGVEAVIIRPSTRGYVGGRQVKGLDWVVEIGQVNGGVSLAGWLVLNLSEQQFVFLFGEIFTFRGVEVSVHTVDLWNGAEVTEVGTALDAQFNLVILQSHQWKRLGPVFAEEEWNHIVITRGSTDTLRVIGNFGGRDRTRGLRLVVSVQHIVNTLHIQRIKLTDFLTPNLKTEFGDRRVVR